MSLDAPRELKADGFPWSAKLAARGASKKIVIRTALRSAVQESSGIFLGPGSLG
jgi:hypothetical protein